MNAKQARVLYEEAESTNANKWFDAFKQRLFTAIEQQAKSRCSSLSIGTHHALNDMPWVSYAPLANKVKTELESLGYTVKFDSDDYQDYVNISW